jgi:hypothetical protein
MQDIGGKARAIWVQYTPLHPSTVKSILLLFSQVYLNPNIVVECVKLRLLYGWSRADIFVQCPAILSSWVFAGLSRNVLSCISNYAMASGWRLPRTSVAFHYLLITLPFKVMLPKQLPKKYNINYNTFGVVMVAVSILNDCIRNSFGVCSFQEMHFLCTY